MPTSTEQAIVFEDAAPRLNAGLFKLTDEQLATVNTILKETHTRYLNEEAKHVIVSVDSNGVQTTEIRAFADQLRAIENEMWTKLDDAVPVEIQSEFRMKLNLYDDGAPFIKSSAASPSASGYPTARDWIPESELRGPGLLGWNSRYFPLTIGISRSGRWFEYSLRIDNAVIAKKPVPELPTELRHYYREPGPWMAVANVRAAYTMQQWTKLADYFTQEAILRELVIANAYGEQQTQDWSDRRSEEFYTRVQDLVARHSEFSAVLKAVESGESSIGLPEIDVDNLILQLAKCPPQDVDAVLSAAIQHHSRTDVRVAFGMFALCLTASAEPKFQPELLRGEVSSYSETGDTATATLTIPNEPPVPIRFKRENGQWKIDAVGSNERLIERVKPLAEKLEKEKAAKEPEPAAK